MIKGQASIEFLFTIGIVFFIFVFMFGYSFSKYKDVRDTEEIIEAKSECYKLANIILNTFLGGNTTKIGTSINYNASITPNNQLITINDFVTCTIPINRTLKVNLNKGSIIIENKNNIISLENV